MSETKDGRPVVKLPTYLDEHGVLTCPDCGCQDFDVYRVKPWSGGSKPRERQCQNCGRIVYTREVVSDE